MPIMGINPPFWEYRVVGIFDIPPNSTADGRGMSVIPPCTHPIMGIVVILKSPSVRLGALLPRASTECFRISALVRKLISAVILKIPLGERAGRSPAQSRIVFGFPHSPGIGNRSNFKKVPIGERARRPPRSHGMLLGFRTRPKLGIVEIRKTFSWRPGGPVAR